MSLWYAQPTEAFRDESQPVRGPLVERAGSVACAEALRSGEDRHGLLAQVACALGRRHDDRGGAVVLGAAVVEMERLDDPA